MIMEYITSSAQATIALAKEIARNLKPNSILLLNGELGAGKTTFAKGIASQLGIDDVVTSPTFTLLNCYENVPVPLYHYDLYRIEFEDELYELGLDTYLDNGGICLIEWNKFSNFPTKPIIVNIEKIDDDSRRFTVE